MTSVLTLRKATRERTKMRVALTGPSGSGKTYSSLLLASGMAPWEKIAMIDTENGSGDLYAHLGPYSVITLTAPFTPERYIEAIGACEKAGMEVIVIDSMTHEWDGKGGILEIVDAITQASPAKNSYFSWGKATPRHNTFIERMLHSSCHVIATVRSKQDYVLTEKKGKQVPEKVGMKAITREGVDYEFTLVFDLNINHFATASKDRTGLFMTINQESEVPEKISKATGEKILEWTLTGKEPEAAPVIDKDTPLPPSAMDVIRVMAACKVMQPLQLAYDTAFEKYLWAEGDAGKITGAYLDCYASIMGWLVTGTQFWKDGLLVATVEKDAKGKATVKVNNTAEEKMADDERAGMKAA